MFALRKLKKITLKAPLKITLLLSRNLVYQTALLQRVKLMMLIIIAIFANFPKGIYLITKMILSVNEKTRLLRDGSNETKFILNNRILYV